ncbi:MAG: MerR family transcriptional regulator [Longimicrobiales bacterium]
MKVGDLAKRTGVSVRALHHYDELGLLVPARRTPSGHRVYGAREIRRLQQIRSLQQLGLTLEEIGACLERRGESVAKVIARHVTQLRQRIRAETELLERLEWLEKRLAAGDRVVVEEFLQVMERMAMVESYYTAEQLEQLKRRGEQVGEARIREVEREWPDLIEAARREMERGTDPTSEPVLALARKWRDLVREFTGGDGGITKSVTQMHRDTVAREGTSHGVDASLMTYVGQAIAALEASGERGLVD